MYKINKIGLVGVRTKQHLRQTIHSDEDIEILGPRLVYKGPGWGLTG